MSWEPHCSSKKEGGDILYCFGQDKNQEKVVPFKTITSRFEDIGKIISFLQGSRR